MNEIEKMLELKKKIESSIEEYNKLARETYCSELTIKVLESDNQNSENSDDFLSSSEDEDYDWNSSNDC